MIFYALPEYPQFYSDTLNLISTSDATCTVMFSKFDKFQLERVVGAARCQKMLGSDKATFLFC